MMSERDKTILDLFARQLRGQYPEAKLWAFGSRANGTARESSDLDVCVVLHDLDEEKDRQVMRTAWRVGFEHDRLISTVTYDEKEFESGPCSVSVLVRTIRREGIAA